MGNNTAETGGNSLAGAVGNGRAGAALVRAMAGMNPGWAGKETAADFGLPAGACWRGLSRRPGGTGRARSPPREALPDAPEEPPGLSPRRRTSLGGKPERRSRLREDSSLA